MLCVLGGVDEFVLMGCLFCNEVVGRWNGRNVGGLDCLVLLVKMMVVVGFVCGLEGWFFVM